MLRVKIIFVSVFLFLNTYVNSQWIAYNLPYNGFAYSMAFLNINTGISCGHNSFPFIENIYYTTNSGANWILAACPPEIRAIAGVQYINTSTIYACGAENIVLSPGRNLLGKKPLALPYYEQNYLIKLGIDGYNADYKGVFIKSTDSGLNWQKAGQFDSETGYLLDLYFFNANTGFIIADSSTNANSSLYKTINGGVNWQKIFLDSNLSLSKIKFINSSTGFVSGGTGDFFQSGNGIIFKTTNGGANWSKTNFLYTQRIQDISFANASTGLALGNSGPLWIGSKIFRTTNSGLNWDSLSFALTDVFPSFLSFVQGSGIALISGYKNIDSVNFMIAASKTTDFGNTWVTNYPIINRYITGGYLIDQNNWFISGGNFDSPAVIFKSTNGGTIFVNNISNSIPDKYYLFQNYPNPFNPSTLIRFEIPFPLSFPRAFSGNPVSLVVFDITGKKITTLVNEQLKPGTYEVTFDASNLPSGIYFYQLKTKYFTETKKALLIK